MMYIIPEGKKLRVAISGKSGCGNTTVSSLLAKNLGIKMINYTFRSLAEETGFSLAEIIEKAKTDDSYDKNVDTRQVQLAMEDSCVLGSRLAIWMLKEADLKVYLFADDDVRAKRILNREKGDLEEIKRFTQMRDNEDTNRYKRLYNIDNNDYSFCDLFVDTNNYNPDQIVELIIQKLLEKKLIIFTGTNREEK
ncbi:MAG: cytidylate kinase family protein [Spirochaetaceae bacterium]|nr:cytidylate kinase [Spirochaetaceae bacterium]MBO5235940.1 cytidylate kinase family protein [Spirochaetaceae bacterium]